MDRKRVIEEGLLVLRCQDGDGQAFAALVAHWQPGLARHLRRVTGVDETDDLAQEVWLAVLRGLPSLQDPDAFAPWLYRIASNKCRDWIRKRQRARLFLGRWKAEVQPHAPGDGVEKRDAFTAAMRALPLAQRELLLWHYDAGLSIDQIAQALAAAPGTVKSRLYHARKALSERLEEQNHE